VARIPRSLSPFCKRQKTLPFPAATPVRRKNYTSVFFFFLFSLPADRRNKTDDDPSPSSSSPPLLFRHTKSPLAHYLSPLTAADKQSSSLFFPPLSQPSFSILRETRGFISFLSSPCRRTGIDRRTRTGLPFPPPPYTISDILLVR